LEIHEIRYFLAVSETLNFTRAAEACNVSQPALTRAIKNLEEKLGGALIHRERSKTHLSELGLMMRPYFAEMLDSMEEARRQAESFVRLKEARLNVGLMCTIGPPMLIDLFSEFNAHYEGVELRLKDGAAGQLEDLLSDGEVDVAIYCRPETPSEALHALPLYQEPLVVVVAPTHPLAKLEKVSLPDLEGQSYLSRVNCEYRDAIAEVRRGLGVNIKSPYASDRDDWIQCMVMSGLGFTIMPEYAVSLQGLEKRPFVEPSFLPVSYTHLTLPTICSA